MNEPIIFVTGNLNKLKEVNSILGGSYNITNEALDLDELQETDLETIALHKLEQAKKLVGSGKRVFVEDTALIFDEFNGLPGAYVKWFVKSLGLAKMVRLLDPFSNKGASAVTTIAYYDGDKNVVFQGKTQGVIVESRGPTDFGWDSIFEPVEGDGETYAEMSKEKKNGLSHRGRAFGQMREYLGGPEGARACK
ncbi:hypothetical protein TBLA_0A08640 [Henningerozyma blattae CBS 6284]|uniref:Inosine triphosphate pyrophosphatase n=1 Tax=Henningerozyma blattae (strain ATCC 34711 / CBS 6284 / DSM 70876 / NBRC 10599 / NRRL Y-10934 / UCD 77-7) TaxID=1071380 RepID=I2GX01_HENB6|nr:hypothetical protein TBLA_0A08640 [Tetrapisispora blattae CBS 6284]CCH58653.1 hypothetical protein TBLA_0A08640 [Tetrapisispora blattae CBS 6284]